MAAGRASRRLGQIAAPLRPERAPFYVRRGDVPLTLRDTFPADGWYWRPHSHPAAIYLGASELDAGLKLAALIRAVETQEDNQ